MNFQLLMQILSALSAVAQSPFAQKVLGCVLTQKGVPAILACITATSAAPGDESVAKGSVVQHLEDHVAANP